MISGSQTLERSAGEHILQEEHVSPAPVSSPVSPDGVVEQEDSALQAIPNQQLEQTPGRKKRRYDADDGLKQGELLDVYSDAHKERPFKRLK